MDRATLWSRFGNTVARHWAWFLVGWVVVLGLAWKYAPAWDEVTRVGEVASLPPHVASVRADELFREAFPLDYSASSIVLAFYRADEPLQEQDKTFVEKEVVRLIGQVAAEHDDSGINTVRSLADRQVGPLLTSLDKKATLVLVDLSIALQDPRNMPVIDKVEAMLDALRTSGKLPSGLQVAITGSATAGRDLTRAEEQSVKAIEVWTVVVVIGLLVVLYRAPLVALIPLVTVFVSVAVAIPILTTLAATGYFPVFRDLRVFITVLAYGAGVDYCLFLIARYREELDAGAAPGPAMAAAIANVGGAITASALTVIAGIGMLAFAQFAKIHQAGLVIPLALGIVLFGTLTVGGSLLLFAGRWAFWPRHRPERPRAALTEPRPGLFGNIWEKVAALLLRWPGTIWVGTVAAMLPFAVVAVIHSGDTNFNPLSDLPPSAPTIAGTRVLEQHFPPGVLGTVVVLVENDKIDFTGDDGVKLIAEVSERLLARKQELEIADVRSFALPLGTTAGAQERIARVRGSKEDVEAVMREEAQGYYVSQAEKHAGHVTRLDITLAVDPLTRRGIDALMRLDSALAGMLPSRLSGSRIELVGPTASLRDLSLVKADDEKLIQALVPLVVFILLLLFFRRIALSIYLILSVLFSYYATLGLTYLVFRAIMGADFDGLDWKVPIFLFTILVAVGEDYNIFLLTRVQEEQKRHGPLGAIPVAMAKTGRVVSSCGFIMAGTFAALLSGSLRAMQELGFALAVGVLVDTLIVRPILVPAFLVLVQRLFPGRLGRRMALGDGKETVPEPPSSWRVDQPAAEVFAAEAQKTQRKKSEKDVPQEAGGG